MKPASRSFWLETLPELGKFRITIAVSFTTITGFILATGGLSLTVVLPTLGLFILACGSSALNHYQEAATDAIMERTRNRPIPSGRISLSGALIVGMIWVLTGSVILYLSAGFVALQLGLLALLWYNGVYTPLKKRTAFAVIPGSLIGAIPPAVGWVAGGGAVSDPRIILVAFFFFIWQVPHFWLLLLKYGSEYENAGLPSVTRFYSDSQIRRMTFIWTSGTIATALMIPLFGLITSWVPLVLLLLGCLWLFFAFVGLLKPAGTTLNPGTYFLKINLFAVLVMVSLIMDQFI